MGSSFPRLKLTQAQKIYTLGGLGLLLVIVIVGTATLLNSRAGGGTASATRNVTPVANAGITATPRTGATATPTDTNAPGAYTFGPPWQALNNQLYGDIAATPGDPKTLLACTAGDAQSARLDISHDGGQNWTTLSSVSIPETSTSCQIVVNPYNRALVALIVGHCGATACDTGQIFPGQVFYSSNGGAQFKQLTLPEKAPQASGFGTWTQDTLFVPVYEASPPGTPVATSGPFIDVLASQNGQPFVKVSQNYSLNGQRLSELRQLGSTSSTVYIGFDPPDVTSIALPAATLLQSADNGASWQPANLQDGNAVVHFITAVPGSTGQTIIGVENGLLLASIAGGHGWSTAPAYPSGFSYISGFVTITPSGTWFAELADGTGANRHDGLYRADPGATSWALVQDLASENGAPTVNFVTWDSAGTPKTLWASLGYFNPQFYWRNL